MYKEQRFVWSVVLEGRNSKSMLPLPGEGFPCCTKACKRASYEETQQDVGYLRMLFLTKIITGPHLRGLILSYLPKIPLLQKLLESEFGAHVSSK